MWGICTQRTQRTHAHAYTQTHRQTDTDTQADTQADTQTDSGLERARAHLQQHPPATQPEGCRAAEHHQGPPDQCGEQPSGADLFHTALIRAADRLEIIPGRRTSNAS